MTLPLPQHVPSRCPHPDCVKQYPRERYGCDEDSLRPAARIVAVFWLAALLAAAFYALPWIVRWVS